MPLRRWLFFGCLLVKNGPRRAMNPIFWSWWTLYLCPKLSQKKLEIIPPKRSLSHECKQSCRISKELLKSFISTLQNLYKILQNLARILQNLVASRNSLQKLLGSCKILQISKESYNIFKNLADLLFVIYHGKDLSSVSFFSYPLGD